MAHYAFLDENNIVTEVITGRNEWEIVDGISNWEEHYAQVRGQRCKRTSYNNNYRRRMARPGGRYDEATDSFIDPTPYPSWELNSDLEWVPPVGYPEDDQHLYNWDEDTRSWVITHNWNEVASEWTQI